MNQLQNLIQNVSGRHYNKIQKLCEPLVNHLEISSFTYIKIKNDGNFYFLGNHLDWMEYYCAEKLYLNQPHFRHPSNFKSGISLSKNIENEEYAQLSQLASNKFNVNFAVAIFNQTKEGMEIIGLDANTPSKLHDIKILNELELIRMFVAKFVKGNQFFMDLLEENQVDLKALIGSKFQTAETPVMATLNDRAHFLKEMGIEIPKLSFQENEVLKVLVNGGSASQIGEILYLSPRTIEHYLERLKNKLNCFSKAELMAKSREFFTYGYFESL